MAKEKEKSEGQRLSDELTFKFKHIGELKPEDIDKSMEFCEGYKSFMNSSKTERECVIKLEKMAVRDINQ